MSIGGDIMEEYYIKRIHEYRLKLFEFINILKAEYPSDAAKLLKEFDKHFNI